MNVLDIAQNSVAAGAATITIALVQNTPQNRQTLTIEDDGKGMDAAMAQQVLDPFCTTRTTRKVGLGLPFLKMAAEMTGGTMAIESTLGKGTTVTASFRLNHIDLAPLGNMGSTVATLVQCNPNVHFVYTFAKDDAHFVFDTHEVSKILGDLPLNTPSVVLFVRDYITEQTNVITRERPV